MPYKFLAPEGDSAGGGGSSETPPAGAPPAGVPPAGDQPAVPSNRDWNKQAQNARETREEVAQLRSEVGTLVKLLTPGTGAKPSEKAAIPADAGQAMAAVEAMRFERDLERALRAAKVPEDSPLTDLITSAATAERPADLREYVQKYAAFATQQPASAPPPKPPQAASNTGTPVTAVSGNDMPADPRQWPLEFAEKHPEEFTQAWQKFKKGNGSFEHPFTAFHQKRGGGGRR